MLLLRLLMMMTGRRRAVYGYDVDFLLVVFVIMHVRTVHYGAVVFNGLFFGIHFHSVLQAFVFDKSKRMPHVRKYLVRIDAVNNV